MFYRSLLMSAAAASAVLCAAPALAQEAQPALPYVMADGTRTADYDAALESWRVDPQFAVDYSKAYMGLEHAYANGLTGAGLTIGIVDSGIYWDHPLFQGRNAGLDTGASERMGNNGDISTELWLNHGTHVAGIAAGRRVAGEQMFGGAFGADVYSATLHFNRQSILNRPTGILGDDLQVNGVAALFATIDQSGARIINNSWGFDLGANLRYDATVEEVERHFADFGDLAVNDDFSIILDRDALVVFAAGNDPELHVSHLNMLPYYVPSIKGNFLNVTNYMENDEHDGSSLCGLSATWCLAGPGHDIVSSIPTYTIDTAAWRRDNAVDPIVNSPYYDLIDGISVIDATVRWFNLHVADYAVNKIIAGEAFDQTTALDDLANEVNTFIMVFAGRLQDPVLASYFLADLVYSRFEEIVTANLITQEESNHVIRGMREQIYANAMRYVTDVEAGYAAFPGTSMASPGVSAFAALLMEKYPEYNTALITDILLSSGRDIEEEGVDIRAGWGVPQFDAALNGPSALRDIREVRVNAGRKDVWSHDITDAIDKYSALVLERNPNDIGGLTKVGGGELELTGASTYSGATRVEGGLLTVSGSLTRSPVAVAQVGILGGTGSIASLVGESGGVVAPGDTANPFGTLTVTGDATFQPGSYLWVRSALNGADYSKLDVGGATTLEGGKVIVKADTGTWNLRSPKMRIVTSEGGVTGAFEGVTSDLGFLTPTLSYTPNAVLLQMQRNDVTIASAGNNANERAAGRALDVMTLNNTGGNLALEDAILDGSFAAVQNSIRYMTGEIHASLGGLTTQNAGFVREALLDRGRTTPASGAAVQALDNRGTAAWASGVFGSGNYDGSKQHSRYRNDTNGFAAGIERTFADNFLIGAAIGQTRSELNIDRLDATGKSTTQQLGLYASTNYRGFGIRAGGTWIDADFDTKRSVRLNQLNERLIGEYSGDGWQAYAEASYAIQAGNTAFEPYANYTRYEFDATLKEKGGDAALGGRVRDKAHLVTAGFRTNTLLAGGEGRPSVSAITNLSYTENLNENGLNYRAHYLDGPKFNVRAAQPGNGAINTTLGIRIRATDAISFDVGYSGLHQSDYNDNRAFGRMSVSF